MNVFNPGFALRQHFLGLSVISFGPWLHQYSSSSRHFLCIRHNLSQCFYLTTLCSWYFWYCPILVHLLLVWSPAFHLYPPG